MQEKTSDWEGKSGRSRKIALSTIERIMKYLFESGAAKSDDISTIGDDSHKKERHIPAVMMGALLSVLGRRKPYQTWLSAPDPLYTSGPRP